MASLPSYDTSAAQQRSAPGWRELPRLLVSRRWRWTTLGVIVLALLCVRLGFWQLDRLDQRRAHNALLAARMSAPPIELVGQPIDVAANEYRRVVVRGTFDVQHEVIVRPSSLYEQPGADLFTPLRIAGSDQAVLVNRGWVPLAQSEPQARRQFAVSGPVQIEGLLRAPKHRSSWGPPDHVPPGGRLDAWYRPDVERIAAQTPYPLLPFYIEQLPGNTQQLPQPHPAIDITDEGPHLSYAIQWFSFAVIGVIGYLALVRSRTREQHRP
ncbi:SURF1 family protein [Kallotenue papyrolyticum]|uniref:SURF1 family protein n=1 Tax=Kallotenue papyrolyticum TaxID=1325125 RepID=UPI0004925A72|nr:SURF1 family protein [Kallotenue papyrolyticum]